MLAFIIRATIERKPDGNFSVWAVNQGDTRVYEQHTVFNYSEAITLLREARSNGYTVTRMGNTVNILRSV